MYLVGSSMTCPMSSQHSPTTLHRAVYLGCLALAIKARLEIE